MVRLSVQEDIMLPEVFIDRTSPVPYYFQLACVLREEIVSRRWQAQQRLASEAEIGEHFGVARSVVRQALARLEDEGVLRREKGRGAFVADSRQRSWLLSEGFFQDEAERLGLAITSRVLRREVTELPNWAAEALGLPRGSLGVTIARLRSIEGRVALYGQNYLPAAHAPIVMALDPDASLYEVLEREAGVVVHGTRRVVEAVSAGDEIGRLLEIPPHAAVAVVESVSWDAELRAFDCFQSWLRTDRTRIEIGVTRSRTDSDEGSTRGRPSRANWIT
jgi:GntR family transcriptional regulator